MVKLLFFRFRVTNLRLKNKKFHFESEKVKVQPSSKQLEVKLNIVQLQVSNWKCNFLFFNFELVTRK